MISPNTVFRSAIPSALMLLVCLSGCGGSDGPERYDVSGSVTFNGQPVPAGEIALEPDGSQGNKGPGSVTRIRAGKYATEDDKGVVGGPYIVRIMGFDGVAAGEASDGLPLFPPYEEKITFPMDDTTQNFDIPKTPARATP